MIGQRFTRLTVIKELDRVFFKTTSSRTYLCKCDCGNEVIALPSNLHRGATKSCGCLKRDTAGDTRRTHGMSNSPEYRIWCGIHQRCYNEKQKEFHLWGGKGITMSEAWKDNFKQFYADMGPRPSPSHSIDRIDGSIGYSKENCRWSTPTEQSLNTTKTHKFMFNGELMSLRQVAKTIGCSYYTLYSWVIRKNIPLNEVCYKLQLPVNALSSTQVPGVPEATHK